MLERRRPVLARKGHSQLNSLLSISASQSRAKTKTSRRSSAPMQCVLSVKVKSRKQYSSGRRKSSLTREVVTFRYPSKDDDRDNDLLAYRNSAQVEAQDPPHLSTQLLLPQDFQKDNHSLRQSTDSSENGCINSLVRQELTIAHRHL